MKNVFLPVSLFILAVVTVPQSLGIGAITAPVNAQQKPAEITIDPKVFDDYVGQYVFPENPDLVLSFFREGNAYYIQASGQGRIEIYPASISKFFTKIIDADATFVRDAGGKVTGVTWRQNDRSVTAKKTSNQPLVETNVAFDRREEMIRMRDGSALHTLIFAPKDQNEPLPMIIERTPYGISNTDSDAINRRYRDLVRDGYIFVAQDIRGRYGSEGVFLMTHPMHDPKDTK
jgi:hypothetical protein